MKRGDIVILEFPYVQGGRGKNRPALIVQNDRDNTRLTHTIVAMISGNTRFAAEPTQLLIDPATPLGELTGLRGPSVVKCGNLFTALQEDVLRVIGHLPEDAMQQVNAKLKAALSL
jgi:mRNA-degrading endonuclease toxin of MazEF toxin-antitoxin module